MKIAIAIPIYKAKPSIAEKASLLQVIKILGKYEIIFFGPQSLDFTIYKNILPNGNLKYFQDSYFESITGYSKLMLSPSFYKQFFDYSYILIYQLDAWVFKDELVEWCKKEFDYIGAPWLEKPPITKKKVFFDISTLFVNKVGNGGLSLRKVKSHYQNTLFFSPILKYFIKNEDMFWGLFLYYLNPFFKRPKPKEALKFAFEMNPKRSFELNNNTLPFGVHAWEKYDSEFWKKYITF